MADSNMSNCWDWRLRDVSKPVSAVLADHLVAIDIARVSARALAMAKMAIVDTIGVTLAGAVEPAVTILADTLAGPGAPGPSLLLGGSRRVSALDAALVNGTAAHAIDYDDMASAMGGHPSVPVVPVAFALGEALGASGQDVLEAYIVGFEAECCLGRVVHPHHYGSGWHPTSTLGVFGAAAAAGRLLRLDAGRTATALAIAASMASGVKANFGTMTKPLHVGHAARDGLLAAQLAARGFTAELGVFEAKEGFFTAYDGLENVNLGNLLARPTDGLEVEQAQFGLKQFPCCGSTHPAILAMLDLVGRERFAAEDVAAIEILAHRRRLPHTDNPNPQTALGGKFSVQYVTARALLDGCVRLGHFEDEALAEPRVRALLARVSARPFEAARDDAAHEFACEVTVTLQDGRELTGLAQSALGRGPANPMSPDEMWEKFSDCAAAALPRNGIEPAFTALNRIEDWASITEMTALLEAAPARRSQPVPVHA